MSDETTNANATLEPIPEWNAPTRDLIVSPNIHIVFMGLFAICNNDDTGQCEVGAFNLSADHFLRVLVWENDQLVQDWTGHAITLARRAYFLYDQSPEKRGVHFFHPTSPFKRDSGHEKDFRWIVDLESSEFYGPANGRRRLTKLGDTVKPRFTVNNGVFYTQQRTRCTFQRQNTAGGSVIPMGLIASAIGLDITIAPGVRNFADISLPGGYSTRMTAEKRYDIFFLNLCNRADCVDETSTNPERQNDFHHYLSTIRGESPLFLMPWQACFASHDPTLEDLELPSTPRLVPVPFKPFGSDRAPCASAGFGGGGGLG
jgi:hypothetical protein